MSKQRICKNCKHWQKVSLNGIIDTHVCDRTTLFRPSFQLMVSQTDENDTCDHFE